MKRALVACLAAATMLVGCNIEDADTTNTANTSEGKHLNVQTVLAANTTDAATILTAFIYNSGTVETLTRLNTETGRLEGGLATNWDTEDAQHWTFHLREGVKFHSGAFMTAEKVKESLEHAIEVNEGIAATLHVESIEVQGEHTLTIVTDQPYASLPSQLAHYNAAIVDRDASDKFPSGTGAFKFASFDMQGNSELVAFEDYWDGRAKLDSVTFSANKDNNARVLALQAGEADVIYRPSLETIDTLASDDIKTDTAEGTRVYQLLYNYRGKHADLFANKEFRLGLDSLVDRSGLAASVLDGHGTPANGPFNPESDLGLDVPVTEFNKEKALEHFEKAGLEVRDGKVYQDGQPLRFEIGTYIARPELPQIAQSFQANAAEVGIAMDLVTAENIDEYLGGDSWDIATFSINTLTRGDGSYFVNGSYLPGGAQNFSEFTDEKLIEMINTFNATIDIDERLAQIKEIGAYLAENVIASYVVFPEETAAMKKEVTGWHTPTNEFEYQLITKDLDLESGAA